MAFIQQKLKHPDSRVFLIGGMGGVPLPVKIFLIHPHLETPLPPVDSLPTKFLFPPPAKVNPPSLNNNFQVNKNSIFSSSHCSCSIFVLIHTLDFKSC